MLRVAISFDYDSPTGYRQSFNIQDMPPDSDFVGMRVLLDVLRKHDLKVSVGFVGRVALPGEPPEHCPDQLREVHAAGHEIASHSMTHRYLPAMSTRELLDELAEGKRAVESCIGAPIRGFIPPFNRPMHYPRRGAFSIAEMFGLHGRGRGRQSVGSLLRALGRTGFGWSRVSFQSKLDQLAERVRIRSTSLQRPFLVGTVVAIPLHASGFGEPSCALVERHLGRDTVLTVYAHPNQATADNDQSAAALSRFVGRFEAARAAGKLAFVTMGEVERLVRRAGEPGP